MISYYELLGMIKEDKAPKEIRVHLTREPRIYEKEDDTEEYCCYVLEDEKKENDGYKYYLMESYMESMIFDETIEILEEEKKIPEKLIIGVTEYDEIHINNEISTERQVREVADKLNEVLDYLKSKGE